MCGEEDQVRKLFVVTLINPLMKHEAKAASGGAPLSVEVMNVIRQFT